MPPPCGASQYIPKSLSHFLFNICSPEKKDLTKNTEGYEIQLEKKVSNLQHWSDFMETSIL